MIPCELIIVPEPIPEGVSILTTALLTRSTTWLRVGVGGIAVGVGVGGTGVGVGVGGTAVGVGVGVGVGGTAVGVGVGVGIASMVA